jgi:hypothetical protein
MLSRTVSPILNLYGDLLAAHLRFGRSLARIWSQPAPDVSRPADPEELLRARAFALYLQRGGEPGHDAEDWDQARTELGLQRVS